MAKSGTGTIRLRWVRSGIAFNRNQKEAVRSLGLRRLHQVVERPDTPGVRGLVAKVAHLVEIVDGEVQGDHGPAPEYTIVAPEPATNGSEAEAAAASETATQEG